MQQLTGKDLIAIIVTLALLIYGLSSTGQTTLQFIAAPLNRVLLGQDAESEPEGAETEGNVVRFTTEPFQRKVLVDAKGQSIGADNYAVSEGVLVGVVEDAREPFVTVRLVTDPQFKAVIKTPGGAQGVIEGDLNAILLTKVPQNQPLEPGDEVQTSGLDGRFTSGIPVGVVREVFNDGELLKSAYVEPYAEIDNLSNVEFR